MSAMTFTLATKDRLQLESMIERLINMLDDLDDDCDLEPNLAGFYHASEELVDLEGDDADDEPWLGWLADGQLGGRDDCEDENEHGGNVTDEPHDVQDEGDDEPWLGWRELWGQKTGTGISGWSEMNDPLGTYGGLRFLGDGYVETRNALRKTLGKKPLKVETEYQERATRLSDGTIFRTLVVPKGGL